MKCPRCQAENAPGTRFCGQCAAPLASGCPSCGAGNPPGNKFCGQCAAPLDKPAQPRFAAPESYTPKYLAEKILCSKAALEGERKQVTVLFADLKGSMELLADRDPEEARKILDPVLERMMEAVHRYEGTVNQVMGDGIMALFGAPLAHEDHAVRACYAALRMQEAVKRYADEAWRAHGVTVRIRVGLNSGEVVVRSIGNDLHMDYTAVGQTTHLAARMEQLASAGSILLTAETLALVEGFTRVTSLGAAPIKGLADPMEVFELIGVGATRRRFEAAAARGLTRFVGRQAELEILRLGLDRARNGQGQVGAPVGEPGVGKSRLCWEFTHSHHTQKWLVLECGAVSYGKTTAYLPVIDLLKTYFRVEDRDDHREIREKVIGRLLTLDRSLEPTLPAFLALLDVPTEDPQWEKSDPGERRQRILEAIKRLLLRESQVQPLLVLVEDLHWIDSETQAVLDNLVESIPTSRIFLIVNYRPEYQHAWGRKSYYNEVRVAPLPPGSAEELLDALLGEDRSLAPLRALLIGRTEGNAFFLEESVQTLVETKSVVGERGAYRLVKDVQQIHVPVTVQALLAARIDRLPPEEKRLLQAASVIGKDIPLVLLRATVEDGDEELHRRLADLQTAEFLYETSLFPDVEYTFKHALTHDVAYDSLLQSQRRALHARIVDVIEHLYADRLVEYVESLAHHAVRGERWDTALLYLRQAGSKAHDRSAYREAAAFFEQALASLEHQPTGAATLEHAVDVRFQLRTALIPLAEFRRALGLIREAESLAETLGDRRRRAQTSLYLSISSYLAGELDDALASAQRTLTLGTDLGNVGLQGVANQYLGFAHMAGTNYRRAEECFGRAIAFLEGLEDQRLGLSDLPSIQSRRRRAWCLAELGRFPEATAIGEDGIRLGEVSNHTTSLAWAYWGTGHAHLRKGELSSSITWLERALGSVRGPLYFPYVATSLGSAFTLSGRLADGLALLERAVEQNIATGFLPHHALTVTFLGEAYLAAGRLSEAADRADHARRLAQQQNARGHEAYALRLLGEIGSRRDPIDVQGAGMCYRRALDIGDELGMRPLVAHCHFGLGKLYRLTGERRQARDHLTTAATMYREMDMAFWLEQAEAEMSVVA